MLYCSRRTASYLISFLLLMTIANQVQAQPARILIYSATAGYRHDSIPTATAALKSKGASINVEFDSTEDKAQFTVENLSRYDALLFLSTTGEVLDAAGKAAFQKYLNMGGNFIGIHSASDTLPNTTFYGREVGAFFDYHPELQDAVVNVLDPTHPSTNMLPPEWRIRDEIYNFKSDPRKLGATVILAANESSYIDNGPRKYDEGIPHPLAWYQLHGAGVDADEENLTGRSFYTSLGHLSETWQDELFLSHVLGGVSWVLRGNTTRATNPDAMVGNFAGQVASSSSNEAGFATIVPSPATTSQPSSAFLHGIPVAICVIVVALGLTHLLG